MPYAILSTALPAERMGVYMGIFNFFIVLPEIAASVALEPVVKICFAQRPRRRIVMLGGGSLLLAAALMLRVREAEQTSEETRGIGSGARDALTIAPP